jgi:hypothetical protein
MTAHLSEPARALAREVVAMQQRQTELIAAGARERHPGTDPAAIAEYDALMPRLYTALYKLRYELSEDAAELASKVQSLPRYIAQVQEEIDQTAREGAEQIRGYREQLRAAQEELGLVQKAQRTLL